MNKYLPFTLLLIIVLLQTSWLQGQSLDSLRQIAWEGDYAKARELCMQRNDYPENTDLLFLTGQTYYWEGNLDKAKEIYLQVINKAPDQVEAIAALATVFVEKNEYSEAIRYANEGLSIDSQNTQLLYNRAFAYAARGFLKEARSSILQILQSDPNNEKALELEESLEIFKIPGAIKIFQSLQQITVPCERKFYTSTVEVPIGDKDVRIIPRFSYGSLLTGDVRTDGSQVGIDFYPLTGPNSYLYFNYAYSEAEIFPSHRSALEWFTIMNKGWGISTGARYLYWEKHQYFISAAGSKYVGSWQSGIRLFYSPELQNGITAFLNVRRYFNNENSFIHILLGYGVNPDRVDRQIDLSTTNKSSGFLAGAYTLFKIGGPIYGRIRAEYNKEEYIRDNWRNVFFVQIGLEYR